MSDRPSAVNGKRNLAWGTLHACPSCGQCLCFGCHPAGPCVDDTAHDESFTESRGSSGFTATSPGAFDGSWLTAGSSGAIGVAGLRMHGAATPGDDRLR
jgi:hypothetical protein